MEGNHLVDNQPIKGIIKIKPKDPDINVCFGRICGALNCYDKFKFLTAEEVAYQIRIIINDYYKQRNEYLESVNLGYLIERTGHENN